MFLSSPSHSGRSTRLLWTLATAMLACVLLVDCGKTSSSDPSSGTLDSEPVAQSALNGNGEPILGEGFVNVTVRCRVEDLQKDFVDVVIQESGEPIQRTAVVFFGRSENARMVPPFNISRSDETNLRSYYASSFELSINLDPSAITSERYPGTTTFTADGRTVTHEVLCGVIQ